MNPKIRRILPGGLALAALAALSYWYFEVRPAHATAGVLMASGTISITQVQIGAELGGRVIAVNVNEGDPVHAGDVLVQLDGALLQAQRAQAFAALQQAQAALTMAQARLDQAQHGNAREADLVAAQAQVDLAQAAYDRLKQPPQPWQLNSARAAVASAQESYAAAVKAAGVTDAQLAAGQALLDKAAANLKVAQQNYDPVSWRPGASALPQAQALQLATLDYQAAEANYAALLATAGPNAQARVLQAAAQLAQARATLNQLEQPYTAADLAAAQASLDLARANLVRLQAPASASDQAIAQAAVDQAQSAVAAAQAALDGLDVQIAKLTITAPVDGVVLTRVIQPGEIALTGATLLVLGLEDEKTITVYVPEERYGEIFVGQEAAVRVDSFPGVSFRAQVISISDKAEFTPRNVQTVEGRKNTVFAVRLLVDSDARLKAGMPADVTFK